MYKLYCILNVVCASKFILKTWFARANPLYMYKACARTKRMYRPEIACVDSGGGAGQRRPRSSTGGMPTATMLLIRVPVI